MEFPLSQETHHLFPQLTPLDPSFPDPLLYSMTCTIQTGKPALQRQHGSDANIWTDLQQHPEESQTDGRAG